jgi:hypothetical protein
MLRSDYWNGATNQANSGHESLEPVASKPPPSLAQQPHTGDTDWLTLSQQMLRLTYQASGQGKGKGKGMAHSFRCSRFWAVASKELRIYTLSRCPRPSPKGREGKGREPKLKAIRAVHAIKSTWPCIGQSWNDSVVIHRFWIPHTARALHSTTTL